MGKLTAEEEEFWKNIIARNNRCEYCKKSFNFKDGGYRADLNRNVVFHFCSVECCQHYLIDNPQYKLLKKGLFESLDINSTILKKMGRLIQ